MSNINEIKNQIKQAEQVAEHLKQQICAFMPELDNQVKTVLQHLEQKLDNSTPGLELFTDPEAVRERMAALTEQAKGIQSFQQNFNVLSSEHGESHSNVSSPEPRPEAKKKDKDEDNSNFDTMKKVGKKFFENKDSVKDNVNGSQEMSNGPSEANTDFSSTTGNVTEGSMSSTTTTTSMEGASSAGLEGGASSTAAPATIEGGGAATTVGGGAATTVGGGAATTVGGGAATTVGGGAATVGGRATATFSGGAATVGGSAAAAGGGSAAAAAVVLAPAGI